MSQINRCRICGNEHLDTLVDLGMQPLANAFLPTHYLVEELYPLKVVYCDQCGLFQLSHIVSPEKLFKEYAYFAGQSGPVGEHFKELALESSNFVQLTQDDLVVDVGSNDGTLLSFFNCRVIGVDPAENVARLAQFKGINTVVDFFGAKVAYDIMQSYGKAKIITMTNTFAHVPNLWDIMAGIKCLLANDGIFVIEVPYFEELFKNVEFDTIYHEHMSYFLVRPIEYLLRMFSMHIVDIKFAPFHGGSMRIFITHNLKESLVTRTPTYDLLQRILTHEYFFYNDTRNLDDFTAKCEKIRNDLNEQLHLLKMKGKRITGYGCPAKGNVLLNYCGIGPEILTYISDTTTYKQGKLSPGMHIPIVSPDEFHKNPPDYALILAWNYVDAIIAKEKEFLKGGGKFIIPFPELTIYGEEDEL